MRRAVAIRLVSLISACAIVTSSVGAQGGLLERIDSAYFGGRPGASLALADSGLVRDSANVPLLWRASRAAITLGFLAPRQASDNPDYLRAERYARRATAIAPTDATGFAWLAAALGRRALFADVLGTARLGEAAYHAANRAIALDSTNAYAHDVLGKVHSEVRNLSGFYRWLAANVLGVSAARHASWAKAELHLRKAVALDPAMVLYRLDLGEVYLRTGRRADAERVLREAAALPRRHPPDSLFQRDALAMLRSASTQP